MASVWLDASWNLDKLADFINMMMIERAVFIDLRITQGQRWQPGKFSSVY